MDKKSEFASDTTNFVLNSKIDIDPIRASEVEMCKK